VKKSLTTFPPDKRRIRFKLQRGPGPGSGPGPRRDFSTGPTFQRRPPAAMKRADEKRTFREEKKEKYKDSLKKGQKHNMSCCFHENVALDETISVKN
jgi:hypothetical protein